MKKFLLILLFGTLHACGCGGVSFAQSYLEKQSVSSYNLLPNPGFENGTAGWTLAAECSLGTKPYGSGVRSLSCTGVTTAKTLAERTISISDYTPYIDDMWKSSLHVVANSNAVEVCGLFNGTEFSCTPVTESVSINAAGYKEYANTRALAGLSASFTFGIRVKTVNTNTTALIADAAYVGPFKGVVGLNPNRTSPEACTPVFTGFGTVSSVSVLCWRDGSNLVMEGRFTSGTSTAVEARIAFPTTFGGASVTLVSSSALPSVSYAGPATSSAASSSAFNILREPNVSYFTVGVQSSGAAGLTKNNGSVIMSSGQSLSFKASVPIQGWGVATVTDVVALVPRETNFSADVSSTGVVSGENVDFLNGSCVVTSTSLFTCAHPTNMFTVKPTCTVSIQAADPSFDTYQAEIVSTNSNASQVQVRTSARTNAGGQNIALGWSIKCTPANPDYDRLRKIYDNVLTSKYEEIFGTRNGACTTSPCTMATLVGASSVTRASTGVYNINVPAGVCAEVLSCGVTIGGSGNYYNNTTTTTTAFRFSFVNSSAVATDTQFSFVCRCKKF